MPLEGVGRWYYKTLHEIYQKTAAQDCRLEDIITEIVLSKAFMYKS